MKKIMSAAALVAMTASTAFANESYTLAVSSGGVDYLCKSETEIIDGVLSRRCVRADSDGGSLFATGGLSTSTAVAGGILTVFVLAAAFDNDDDTPPTNGSN